MQRFRGLRASEAVLSALVTLLLLALAIACFVTRMEALYRVWKDEGERSGRLAYEQLQSLPIQWVDQTEPLLLEASRIKASHPLSVADAWIAATALLSQATLLHKDPEFEAITQLDQSWLA